MAIEMKFYKNYVEIGLNILRYRKERGLTQMQLAELAGLSRNHIQKVETAAAVPSLSALMQIAKALDIPVSRLLEHTSSSF
ncbi:MAG TPA: helix-turn-helix domain-containing protein [Firmicutes bacterium]|nr:helix-turn-helix domain-containing protein [Bacillota bacterium]